MDRKPQIERANKAVHAAIQAMIDHGHDHQDLSNVLLAYALSDMANTQGRQAVARHLYLLALKFADPQASSEAGIPTPH